MGLQLGLGTTALSFVPSYTVTEIECESRASFRAELGQLWEPKCTS